MVICVILTPFPFYKNIFFFQADIVLIKVVLYLPNFSLMFLIHVFLYAGVYCIHWIVIYPVGGLQVLCSCNRWMREANCLRGAKIERLCYPCFKIDDKFSGTPIMRYSPHCTSKDFGKLITSISSSCFVEQITNIEAQQRNSDHTIFRPFECKF